ncbi:MAG: hypothetical protein HY961_10725 [Ignavibacteriae bacterium]|nr:hypothetical protein [Ignavibacteriota bacterium]
MAAEDTLRHFLQTVSMQEQAKVQELVRNVKADFFAARSEDARVRLVHDFMEAIHDRLRKTK